MNSLRNNDAKVFFASQKKGSKGIKLAIERNSKRRSLVPTPAEFLDFEKNIKRFDLHSNYRLDELAKAEEMFMSHLWLLQLNFNLLFYGIGNKRKLLMSFAQKMLTGEDVLFLNGSMSSNESITRNGPKILLSLLDTIAVKILNQPEATDFFESPEKYSEYIAGIYFNMYR